MDCKELLDTWWDTEPFGFDHPDTYSGILKLLVKVNAENNRYKEALEEIKQDSKTHPCDCLAGDKAEEALRETK